MERLMPRNMAVGIPDRVLVIGTVEDNGTVGHKLWENQLFARGYDPTSWLNYDEDCGAPTRRARVATLCIRRGSSPSRTPLPFSLVEAEQLPPRSVSFALTDYKMPARAYIKYSIKEGRNPLLPNYVGHIGRKPVYEADGTLKSIDDILIRTERGVREVTTEEWGKLKGYPPSWGTTAKDRRRIIQEPSLHFWSVLGDAFAPTLIHP
jgi:site-specific DNA-cytosine methylase